jgi:predicted RNA-binding protein YlxR (DUF448 family)
MGNVRKLGKRRTVWLVIREDEPGRGEWFAREREASLKATWLRQSWKAKVHVVKASVVDEEPA